MEEGSDGQNWIQIYQLKSNGMLEMTLLCLKRYKCDHRNLIALVYKYSIYRVHRVYRMNKIYQIDRTNKINQINEFN